MSLVTICAFGCQLLFQVQLKDFLQQNRFKLFDLNQFEAVKKKDVGNDGCQSVRSLYVRAIASGMDPASRSSIAQKRFGYKLLKDGQTILEDAMGSQSYHKVTEWIMAGGRHNHQTRRTASSEPVRKVPRRRS